jgi:hypothetical protein
MGRSSTCCLVEVGFEVGVLRLQDRRVRVTSTVVAVPSGFIVMFDFLRLTDEQRDFLEIRLQPLGVLDSAEIS